MTKAEWSLPGMKAAGSPTMPEAQRSELLRVANRADNASDQSEYPQRPVRSVR